MFKESTGKHYVVSCDSLAEFTDYSRTLEDHASHKMSSGAYGEDFYGPGIESLGQVHAMSDTGLVREGIEAIQLANVGGMERETTDQHFQTRWDTQGSAPDVARYLSGEPENMLDYFTEDIEEPQLLATLVVNVAVNCNIDAWAFTRHGQSLVALCEAIDGSGMQSEIWADATIRGNNGYTGRFKVLMKAPGSVFDPGAFMFGLTHPAFFRGMQLNAMYDWPAKWKKECSVPGHHGSSVSTFIHQDDYPDSAIYIPAMQRNEDAGKHLPDTLKQLGLI